MFYTHTLQMSVFSNITWTHQLSFNICSTLFFNLITCFACLLLVTSQTHDTVKIGLLSQIITFIWLQQRGSQCQQAHSFSKTNIMADLSRQSGMVVCVYDHKRRFLFVIFQPQKLWEVRALSQQTLEHLKGGRRVIERGHLFFDYVLSDKQE